MGKWRHYEENAFIPASVQETFSYIDDHSRFSSHMTKSSWMMAGGKMDTQVDEGKGQKIGSHIRMAGKVFGINLFLDEVIVKYQPPFRKIWETVGDPKLLVIGNYQMGIEVSSKEKGSEIKIFIDYDLPSGNTRVLGYLFGGIYAKWCVRRMLGGVREHFQAS